jgi:hypothetical protein
MALLIKNGEIVTVGARERADIFVEDETITRIGRKRSMPAASWFFQGLLIRMCISTCRSWRPSRRIRTKQAASQP